MANDRVQANAAKLALLSDDEKSLLYKSDDEYVAEINSDSDLASRIQKKNKYLESGEYESLNLENLNKEENKLILERDNYNRDDPERKSISTQLVIVLRIIELKKALINGQLDDSKIQSLKKLDPNLIINDKTLNVDLYNQLLHQAEEKFMPSFFNKTISERVDEIIKIRSTKLLDMYKRFRDMPSSEQDKEQIDAIKTDIQNKRADLLNVFKERFNEKPVQLDTPQRKTLKERWEDFKLTFREGGKPDGKIKRGRVVAMALFGGLAVIGIAAFIVGTIFSAGGLLAAAVGIGVTAAAAGAVGPIAVMISGAAIATVGIAGAGSTMRAAEKENVMAKLNTTLITAQSQDSVEELKTAQSQDSVKPAPQGSTAAIAKEISPPDPQSVVAVKPAENTDGVVTPEKPADTTPQPEVAPSADESAKPGSHKPS